MTKKIFKITKKNLAFILLLVTVGLLVDEVRTEGYLFKLADVITFRFTHEKFALLFFLGGLYVQVKKKKKHGK